MHCVQKKRNQNIFLSDKPQCFSEKFVFLLQYVYILSSEIVVGRVRTKFVKKKQNLC